MERNNNYLLDWVEILLAQGRNTFTLKQVREEFSGVSQKALSLALNRLTHKNKIASVHKGFYVIISPEHSIKRIVPPILFIDSLMKHIRKPYYVGLLSAAALHGSSHQAPREFFVINQLPALRSVEKKGIRINFAGKVTLPLDSIKERKIATGYVNVSDPELTALDLIYFEKYIGGLNRASTVIYELSDSMDVTGFTDNLLLSVPVVILQRLGYILDRICGKDQLADALFKRISSHYQSLVRRPLKPGISVRGFSTDPRWKLIINTKIETDL